MKRLIFFMKYLLPAITCFVPVLGFTQVQQEWVAKYNGSGGSHDGATALEVDADGNVYVTGFSYVSEPIDDTETFKDIATIKYNTAGEQQWAVRYNGSSNGADHAVDIALDAAGNVYITGYSTGSETDDTNPNSRYDYITIKYDANGNELWVARYNGPGNGRDQATALEVDAAGNVYVTGSSSGNGTGNDYATIKYDTDGVLQWVKRYNGPENLTDGANNLVLDAASNVYVTGLSLTDASTFLSNAVTIKYDTNGNVEWVNSYGGPENMSGVNPRDLALDGSGNLYVTGYIWSGYDSDGLQMFDYITLKYDEAGTLQWVRFYDSSELVFGTVNEWRDDFARALAVDAEGNIYVTGQSGNREEDPDNAYLTIKYNTSGDELWVALYDGPGGPQGGSANAIELDAEGNVYVTGQSSISDGFSDVDYATIKYNPQGEQQWVMTYDGPGNYWDNATDIAVDALGNVYVTGQSYISNEDVYYTDMDSEYATIKYSQQEVPQVGCDGNENKVEICHKGKTICVSVNALAAHLRHGDRVGPCSGNLKASSKGKIMHEGAIDKLQVNVYPNPASDNTKINFLLPAKGEISVTVIDVRGRTVANITGKEAAGYHSLHLDTSNLQSGIYLLKVSLNTGGETIVQNQRMVVLK